MRENDTYQLENENRLENIEWDDIWRQCAPDNKKPRVLMIGDSIVRSYRAKLNVLLNDEAYADQLATSKSVADSGYIPLLRYMKSQEDSYKLVIFNNGLHGFCLGIKEYEENYRKLILEIKSLFPNSIIAVTLSTPVRDKDDLHNFADVNDVVIQRNEAVKKIAKENGIECINYYSLLEDKEAMYAGDGVHVTECGQDLLAKRCFEYINSKSLI